MALITAMIFIASCEKKDVFNPNKVKATYEDRFPVKDIDPNMDWKMTHKVNVRVGVYEDAGVDYTVRLYDKDPLSNSSALLLAQGTANNTMPFTTTIDCPTAQTHMYVCRLDPQNRSVVKLDSIENNTVDVNFGIPPQAAALRASTRQSAVTRSSDEATIQTPDRSESDIAALASSASELQSNTILSSGKVYKISSGKTFTDNITTYGIDGPVATVIIQGTWAPTSWYPQINKGVDLIVMSTGKIVLHSLCNLSLVGSTRIIAYNGSSISGKQLDLSNSSNGKTNYFLGNLNLKNINSGGSTNGTYCMLYNGGSFTVDDLNLSNFGDQFINMGTAVIGATKYNTTVKSGNKLNVSSFNGKLINTGYTEIANTVSNCKIDNRCYLKVTDTFAGDLTLGKNCAAVIDEYSSGWGKNIIMGDNSMLTINTAYFTGTNFIGSNKPSLIRVQTLLGFQLSAGATGYIYFEFKNIGLLASITNILGLLPYYSKWGESPIIIPEGDCTGSGNTPNDSGSGTGTNPINYTYVFEDNFPLVGDYDFNDVVLDVTTGYQRDKNTNVIRKIQLNVTLTAAGASKTLGAGLRIVGIDKSAIKSITGGGDYKKFQETLTNPRDNKLKFFRYNSSSNMEDGDNSIVIPLFNNVHQVFGVNDGSLVNTLGSGPAAINGQKAYTYEITIELADQSKTVPIFSKDNLDFFICYKYKNMEKRMEVHLYEFWNYGATAAGTVQKENLDLAGNNTWALCVPNFRYPKENVNISITSNPSEGAYPKFINWARNRSTNKDWYLWPNEDKVCR